MSSISELSAKLKIIDAEIRAMEASLASFQKRLSTGFDPGIDKLIALTSSTQKALASKLVERNAITGQIGTARESSTSPLSQYERDIKALDTLYQKLNRLNEAKFSQMASGDFGIARGIEKEIQRAENDISRFQTRIRNFWQGRAQILLKGRGTTEGIVNIIPPGTGGAPDKVPGPDIPPVLTRAQMAAAAEAERLARLQAYYSDPAQQRYAQARQIAEAKGFGPGTLQNITEVGLAGIQRMDFAEKDLAGVNRHLKMFVDQTGKALPAASRQFNTFASSVVRDIGELAKWTIAIGVIYGPLNKLKELVTLMVANETKLADASIIVSDSTLKMGQVFDIASEAADAMGENVSEVITNFAEAYQATGGLGSAMERTRVASQLMNDALILSKLSTLSASESIDTLAAALRQSNTPLDQGTRLLDKWVKVTKVANVDLTTLAVGFSVLGEAAESAGLSEDELNAVIATTSETLGTSGREAANAARAFVAGFQSDKAVRALNDIGIAVIDTTGNMRSMLDIQRDIYAAYTTGLISATQFSRLTLAIGGGTRRQAAVAGFIQQYPRVAAIVSAQQESTEGLAAQALAKRLDTVQTAMTRLQNAFQSLAQSMGDEGGLLDIFRVVLDIMTSIVKVADQITSAIGKTGPMLMMALAVGGYAKIRGPLWGQVTALNIADKFGYRPPIQEYWPGGGISTLTGERTRTGQTVLGGLTGQNRIASTVGAAIFASILPVMQNLSTYREGTNRFGRAKAEADVLGAVIGGAAGSAFGGMGAMIGASIGASIAESFVNKATEDLEASNVFGGKTVLTGLGIAYGEEKTARDLLAGGGLEGGIKQLVAEWTTGIQNWWVTTMAKSPTAPEGAGAVLTTAEEQLYNWLSDSQRAAYDKWYAEQIAGGKIAPPEGIISPFETAAAAQKSQYQRYMDTIRKAREEELLNKLITGEITPTAYKTKMETLANFDTKAAEFFTAFGDAFMAVSDDIDTANEAYATFLDLFTYGSEEQVNQLTELKTAIADILLQIETLKQTGTTGGPILAGLEAQLAQYRDTAAQMTNAMQTQLFLQQNPIPTIINQQPISGTTANLTALLQRGAEIDEQIARQLVGYTDEEIEKWRQGFEDFGLIIDEGGNAVYYKLSALAEKLGVETDKISTDGINQAIEEFAAAGLIILQNAQQTATIQQVPFGSERAGEYFAAAEYYVNLARQYNATAPEGSRIDLATSPVVVWFSDDQLQAVTFPMWALVRGQEKLTDIAQKQLEQGIWNLPEGASFWVNIDTLWNARHPSGSGGTGGAGGVGAPNVPPEGGMGAGGSGGTGVGIPPGGNRMPIVPAIGRRNLPINLDDYYPELIRVLRELKSKEQPWSVEKGYPPGSALKIIESTWIGIFTQPIIQLINMLKQELGIRRFNFTNQSKESMTSTKIDLNLKTSTTVNLDGRVIANIIKSYIRRDLASRTTAYGKTGSDNAL